LSDDLVEVQWFSPEEVVHIEQVPWTEDLLRKIDFIHSLHNDQWRAICPFRKGNQAYSRKKSKSWIR
jgi:hypothetical protein